MCVFLGLYRTIGEIFVLQLYDLPTVLSVVVALVAYLVDAAGAVDPHHVISFGQQTFQTIIENQLINAIYDLIS